MKAIRYPYVCIMLLFLMAMPSAHAQKVQADSVIVNTVFQPTIADAYKINDNPSMIDSVVKMRSIEYGISPKAVNTTYNVEPIKSAVMVGEPLTKLYKSLVKVGFGNYSTPYGEYFFNNLRSKESSYGLHLKHLSSDETLENAGYSGYSNNEVNLYGKKFLKKHTLWTDLDYTRNVMHCYGYNVKTNNLESEVTRQKFSFIAPQIGITSHFTDSSKTNYQIGLKYANLSDYYKATEDNVMADVLLKAYVEKQLLNVEGTVDYYHNKNGKDTSSNTIIKLNPSFIASGQKWRTSLGVSLCTDLGVSHKFYFYPSIDFNFDVIDQILVPYAGVSGGLQKNSLKSLSDENPFMITDVVTQNTSRKYEVYGGIRGTIGSSMFYNLSASTAKINSMVFFSTNFSDPVLKNKFVLLYDDVTRTNLHGELQYQADQKLRLLVKGDYFRYKMDNELEAWYKPGMQLSLSAHYNLQNKIVAKADVFIYGKRQAPVTDSGGKIVATELKGITDVNIGLEYRYTKILSAFLNFNNILSTRAYHWYQYPDQRFNFLAGISYAF